MGELEIPHGLIRLGSVVTASPGTSETRFVCTGDCLEGETTVTADCVCAGAAESSKAERNSTTVTWRYFTGEILIFIIPLS